MSLRQFVYLSAIMIALAQASCARTATEIRVPKITVHFSPNGGCTSAIVDQVQKAKHTLLIQAFHFTSEPIAKAVVEAHKRGVKVQVILDKRQETNKRTMAALLINAGVPVFTDVQHEVAHNKVMVIDGHVTITGSFNFTNNAEDKYAENLIIIQDASVAAKYAANWQSCLEKSVPFVQRELPPRHSAPQ